MFRSVAWVALVVGFNGDFLIADEPSAPLVVATDHRTAALLPQLPRDARVVILVQDESESVEVVDARALKLREATHFVYDSRQESPLTAIYRERLRNYGAAIVDVRVDLQQGRPVFAELPYSIAMSSQPFSIFAVLTGDASSDAMR